MSMFQNLMGWVDARFPATKMFEDHMSKYYAPKNFNVWYFFGSLAMLVLVNQLLTGIWLTSTNIARDPKKYHMLKFLGA